MIQSVQSCNNQSVSTVIANFSNLFIYGDDNCGCHNSSTQHVRLLQSLYRDCIFCK